MSSSIAGCLSPQTCGKKINPNFEPLRFAYTRAALELTLNVSSAQRIALLFSISRHVYMRQEQYYSAV